MSKSEVVHANCIEHMRGMRSDSVGAVITSPPYNMNLRIRNGGYCSRQIVKEISTKYDKYDDNLSMEDYLLFIKSAINECLRVSPLVFFNIQMVTGNKPALFKMLGYFADKIKEVIVWDKVNAQPAIQHGVMNSQYEWILVFDKENAMSRMFKNAAFERGTLPNLWRIKRDKALRRGGPYNGATFPESLVYTILDNFPPAGPVLDPFMGTGTTGIVCKRLGYDFIGIDTNLSYCRMAEDKLDVT